MQFIKGTFEQCEQYNSIVCQGEKYNGITQRWADSIKCNGYFAIPYNNKYPTNLQVVESIEIYQLKETTL